MNLPVNPGGPASPAFGPDNTPFDAIGGAERVRELVDRFYDRMDTAEYAGIRDMHPESLEGSREKLYLFLSGWLGGPPLYIEKYGHPRLRGRHMPFRIGDQERDAWMACMRTAMDEMELDGELRTFLDARFMHVATFMRNA